MQTTRSLQLAVDAALTVQHPLAVHNVARLRRLHPDKSPEQLVSYLNRVYIGGVAVTGAGVAAIITGEAKSPSAFAGLLTFVEASVLYTLSVAEIHGLDIEDIERRNLLAACVLLGNGAATASLEPLVRRTAPYWAKKIVQSVPEPPWVAWRLLTLETRMELCRKRSHLGSRPRVGIRKRRRMLRCVRCVSCARNWARSMGRCSG